MLRYSTLLYLGLTLLGCNSASSGRADGGTQDSGPVAVLDAGEVVPPACRPGERELVTVSDPEALLPDELWQFAYVENDPWFGRFIDGTMERPRAGEDALGVAWETLPLLEPGVIGRVTRGAMYAVGSVAVPSEHHVLARASRIGAVMTRGGLTPGDVYGAGWSRVPLVVEPGATNDVFVRLTPSRGAAQLELFSTPDEVYLNLADRTFPHLRVGDASEQWLGVAFLNLTGHPLAGLRAQVVESDDWEATEVSHVSIPAGATTQIAFELQPKRAWATPDDTVPVTLRILSDCLERSYEVTTELSTVSASSAFRRTFRSGIDGSVQYYGVQPPVDFDPEREYALVLSLHGASVEAIGQARSYAAKDWAYIVSPTNRRPFGFDWEAWGRLDGLEVLDHATESYRIDPTQVYLTGHSMGGHGTWQLGVHFPGRFALVGPSAGWSSFYSYGGAGRPGGAFARSMASSDTNNYASNLARRAVYILHGDADDNVPVSEARAMRALVEPLAPDFGYHEQPGAGHWWDASPDVPGTDCVDWAPMFTRMSEVRLDPSEVDFDWTTPSPSLNDRHSFVQLISMESAAEDAVVTSRADGETGVSITTQNVRSMVIDGGALTARGVTQLTVDGSDMTVVDAPMEVGPQTGKTPAQYGPFNQAMATPWCWVYPDEGGEAYRFYASYLATFWSIIGNGAACALPASEVTSSIRSARNLIWLGVSSAETGVAGLPFSWDRSAIMVGSAPSSGAVAFVYPSDEHLDAFVATTSGEEHLLYSIIPFTSRLALPDYLAFTRDGVTAAGFFDAEWAFAP